MNLLITNIGRRVYFVDFLVKLKRDLIVKKIFVSDNNKNISGMNVKNTTSIITPRVKEGVANYLNSILSIVKKNKIRLIIPCTNYDLAILSKNKKKFDLLDSNLSISRPELIDKLLDKKKMYKLCVENKIPTPQIFNSYNEIKKFRIKKYIKKKIFGHSSLGLKIIKKIKKSDFEKDFMIQKFIRGQEYHMDILNDANGNFLNSCTKKKLSMRFGETDIAKLENSRSFVNFSKKISKIFNHVGNLDCDFILDKKGKFYFIDFNPRFGGGYAFTHSFGFDFLKLYISSLLNKKIKLKKKLRVKIFSKSIQISENK